METFLGFLKKEKKLVVKNETPYFKYNHVRYYTKELKDGTIEFWGHPTEKSSEKQSKYLGKYKDGELTKPEDFYSFYMNDQRCAIRLWHQVGVYEVTDQWWVGR